MTVPDAQVFIVDDDPSVCRALARLLTASGYRTLTFGSAREFLAAAHGLGAGCLLLDVQLPDLSGIELFHELQHSGTFLPVIFVTGFGDIPMSVHAIKSGAFDFLTKPIEEETLLRTVQSALREAERMRAEGIESHELQRRYESLTPRELDVMRGVLAGRLNKQIARDLGISEKTVKVHRSRVMTKMGARRVANLVHFAARIGIQLGESDSRMVRPATGDERAARPLRREPDRTEPSMGDPLPDRAPDVRR